MRTLILLGLRMEDADHMMTTKSYRMDEATLERMELIEAAREKRTGRRTLDTTATQVIRDAVELLFRFELGGESIISPEDPRFF